MVQEKRQGTLKTTERIRAIRSRLLLWYSRHKRDLPWRNTEDPYKIAVSEVMLQQTQVERVVPKYRAWVRSFPTVRSLARAPLLDVMERWSGLGYNNRAVRLRETARAILAHHHGIFPEDVESLKKLPGFGDYTAGAVATFAFAKPVVIIDTNIRRVVGRMMFGVRGPRSERALREAARTMLATRSVRAWGHALMDLGAMVCRSAAPKCTICPMRRYCLAYPAILHERRRPASRRQSPFPHSDRFWRGRILSALLRRKRTSVKRIFSRVQSHGKLSQTRFRKILSSLERDSIVAVENGRVGLRG